MSSQHSILPRIIYQDAYLVILEKPAKMPSTAANSVEEWLRRQFPDARLVHRLDNNTSGLMVAAKTETAFHALRAVWQTKAVTKKYTALVLGKTKPQGKITTPIAHHPRKKKKMSLGGLKARPAETLYKTIRHLDHYSLVEIQITTGVRHQIRIHMASVGHPLAGDKIYQKVKYRAQETLNLDRHLLHLSYLRFPHPLTGEKMEYRSTPNFWQER